MHDKDLPMAKLVKINFLLAKISMYVWHKYRYSKHSICSIHASLIGEGAGPRDYIHAEFSRENRG